jgi:hypothetical protein
MLELIKREMISRLIELSIELADQRMVEEFETASWNIEVATDDNGNLVYAGKAQTAFNEYYDEYFKLCSNVLLS